MNFIQPTFGYFYIAYATAIVVVNVFFAVAVFIDSQSMKRTGGMTFLVPGVIWALAVLFGGVFSVAAYWFIHHSSLRSLLPPWTKGTDT